MRSSGAAALIGIITSVGLGAAVVLPNAADRGALLEAGAFFVALLATGLVAGLFLGIQLGQLRVQETLPQRDFVLLKHRFEVAMGGMMPPVLIGASLSPGLVLLAVRDPGRLGFQLAAVSLALWIATVAITLVYNVPVNNAARTWNADHPPTDWEALRTRWHRGQSLRALTTPPAFAALVAAALAR